MPRARLIAALFACAPVDEPATRDCTDNKCDATNAMTVQVRVERDACTVQNQRNGRRGNVLWVWLSEGDEATLFGAGPKGEGTYEVLKFLNQPMGGFGVFGFTQPGIPPRRVTKTPLDLVCGGAQEWHADEASDTWCILVNGTCEHVTSPVLSGKGENIEKAASTMAAAMGELVCDGDDCPTFSLANDIADIMKGSAADGASLQEAIGSLGHRNAATTTNGCPTELENVLHIDEPGNNTKYNHFARDLCNKLASGDNSIVYPRHIKDLALEYDLPAGAGASGAVIAYQPGRRIKISLQDGRLLQLQAQQLGILEAAGVLTANPLARNPPYGVRNVEDVGNFTHVSSMPLEDLHTKWSDYGPANFDNAAASLPGDHKARTRLQSLQQMAARIVYKTAHDKDPGDVLTRAGIDAVRGNVYFLKRAGAHKGKLTSSFSSLAALDTAVSDARAEYFWSLGQLDFCLADSRDVFKQEAQMFPGEFETCAASVNPVDRNGNVTNAWIACVRDAYPGVQLHTEWCKPTGATDADDERVGVFPSHPALTKNIENFILDRFVWIDL